MIAIGIGCRTSCPAADILALIEATLALLPQGLMPDGIFSIAEKRGESGLRDAATRLGLPLAFFDRAVLERYAGGAQTASQRTQDLFGLPSVAETAALAGAGEGAALLVVRQSSARVSCAVAGPPA